MRSSGIGSLLALVLTLVTPACGDDSGQPPRDATADASALGDAAVDAAGPDAALDCSEQELVDVEIPLRDGKVLGAFARRPTTTGCRLPTILVQTPYNKENARSQFFESTTPQPLFDSLEYAFVVTDWRGFYSSSAAAVTTPDYGADGYDAVEWIASQPWSDGQVATWGVSALGRVQYWTAVTQPPHLKAAVPIFCAMNNTYEENYPGGVLRREYVDLISQAFGQSVVEDYPLKSAAWGFLANLYDPADVTVPMLLVAGWYDLDNERSFRDWEALAAESPAAADHRLLIGAWHHFAVGGESGGAGRPLTTQELEYVDTQGRIQRDSLAWFEHHLRGQDAGVASWARVRYVQAGEDTWLDAAEWPPPTVQDRTFFLRADGTLGDAADSGTGLTLDFDPQDPSPTIGGQTLRLDLLHGPQDQADVLSRAGDHLVFTTAPLTAPLRLRGRLTLHLAVSTDGADTDFVVRVTDVDPSGTHLLLTDGVRRLSLRDTYSAKSTVTAGTRYEVEVPLTNQLGYTLATGHRLGLIVSSSNWPRFARNPGTGDNFMADTTSPQAVTNTVLCDAASHLRLSVEP